MMTLPPVAGPSTISDAPHFLQRNLVLISPLLSLHSSHSILLTSPCHASAAPSKARLNAEIGTTLARERGRMLPTSQTAPVWRAVRLSILSEFYKMNGREGHAMSETLGAPVSQSLVTRIVSSYVRTNKVPPADIPNL